MMGAYNYGLGNRDMARAGYNALRDKSGMSFSSIATMAERWGEFCAWAKAEGIKRMEKIGREDIIRYGVGLADKVKAGNLSAATAQNYVSAVNRVMEIARGDRDIAVSPTRACGIPHRTGIAAANRAVGEEEHGQTRERLSDRARALLDLQRSLGLRFKESALLDARKALREAQTWGAVRIVDGTKGGRARTVPAAKPEQIAALEHAAALQEGRSMVPQEARYADFARECYREFTHWHGERHAYAQARYEALTGAPCPVASGIPHGTAHHAFLAERLGISIDRARETNQAARLRIAEELGHGRVGITNAYLG